MKADFKRVMMGMLKLKHKHVDPFTGEPSMSEALKCNKGCGEQVMKAQDVFNKRRKSHPEEFIYKKPEFKRSNELENKWDMLFERIKKDPLYRQHLHRLQSGTESQKDEEIKKANEQYYSKHYVENDQVKKIKE